MIQSVSRLSVLAPASLSIVNESDFINRRFGESASKSNKSTESEAMLRRWASDSSISGGQTQCSEAVKLTIVNEAGSRPELDHDAIVSSTGRREIHPSTGCKFELAQGVWRHVCASLKAKS